MKRMSWKLTCAVVICGAGVIDGGEVAAQSFGSGLPSLGASGSGSPSLGAGGAGAAGFGMAGAGAASPVVQTMPSGMPLFSPTVPDAAASLTGLPSTSSTQGNLFSNPMAAPFLYSSLLQAGAPMGAMGSLGATSTAGTTGTTGTAAASGSMGGLYGPAGMARRSSACSCWRLSSRTAGSARAGSVARGVLPSRRLRRPRVPPPARGNGRPPGPAAWPPVTSTEATRAPLIPSAISTGRLATSRNPRLADLARSGGRVGRAQRGPPSAAITVGLEDSTHPTGIGS